jgi:hypothetical protein
MKNDTQPTGVLITSAHNARDEVTEAVLHDQLDRIEAVVHGTSDTIRQLADALISLLRREANLHEREGNPDKAAKARASADDMERRWAA